MQARAASFQATKPGKIKLHESSSMANAKEMSKVATATKAQVHEKTLKKSITFWWGDFPQQVNRFVEDGSASFHSEKLGEE